MLTILDSGIAFDADWQKTEKAQYDDAYYQKLEEKTGSEIGKKITRYRAWLTARIFRLHGIKKDILDFGCGNCEFIRSMLLLSYQLSGYDVIPKTAAALAYTGRLFNYDGVSKDLTAFNAVTFWDVAEHMPDFFSLQFKPGSLIFMSCPTFDKSSFRDGTYKNSRHYRPGEHYWYFTVPGLITHMSAHGHSLRFFNVEETRLGRDSIGTFVFKAKG